MDSEIIACVIHNYPETDSDIDAEEDSISVPSTRKVQIMLSVVHRFYLLKSNLINQIFDSIAKLESNVTKRYFTQLTHKKVADYFK